MNHKIRLGGNGTPDTGLGLHTEDIEGVDSAALAERLGLLANALDHGGLALAIFDREGRIAYANKPFCLARGRTLKELLGHPASALEDEHAPRQNRKKLWNALRNGKPWEGELVSTGADGGLTVEKARLVPLHDQDGRLTHSLLYRSDITREKAVLDAVSQSEALYRALVDNIQMGVMLVDREYNILMANAGLERMLGKEPGSLEGCKCHVAMELGDAPCPCCPAKVAMETGCGAETRMLLTQAEGGPRWLHFRAFPHYGGGIQGFIEVVADVTDQVNAEIRQRRNASVFDNTHDGIVITDANGTILEVNKAFTRLTGYTSEEAVGQNARMLQSGQHDRHFYEALWQGLLGNDGWEGEITNRRKDGSTFLESLTIHAVRDAEGRLLHYLGVFSDITRVRETQTRLESLAHFDPLTCLPNRVLFADRMNQALAQARRHQTMMAVGYLDLDCFKPINDTHGHHVGDRLLIEIAQRLKAGVRANDTVARLGGDEFALVLVDLEGPKEARLILDRMLGSIEQPVLVNDLRLGVSASIGVTLFPQDDSDAETLLRHADQAMYAAKQSGRATCVIFDAERDRLARNQREMLTGVRLALVREEFLLYYQPTVDMRQGTVVGAEALLRWRHPTQGLLVPAHFLTAIEDSDLSAQVDRWAIAKAIQQMAAWAAKDIRLTVSVNISARLLLQPGLDVWLQEQFSEYPGVSPRSLELEILETAALEDVEMVSRVIEACGLLGVTFALDDFGTGYSSLTYLKRLPITTLKIDRTFIANMLDDPEDLAIVDGVLSLASSFNLRVVAEGVESASQGNVLMQFGCDVAQGYGLAMPMPASRLEEWIANFQLGYEWSPSTLPVERDDLPLLSAQLAHRRWIDQVLQAVENGAVGSWVNLDVHACGFGRWYDRRGREKYGFLEEYGSIRPIHLAMHDSARRLLAAATMGEQQKARAERLRLLELQDELMAKLDDLRVAINLLKNRS
jgi:diguanylate cyclase (GGDEF)-like protein/PAS domain S-box-containing protein